MEQIVSIDLGSHSLKATYVHKKNGRLSLGGFALREVPATSDGSRGQPLNEQLVALMQALGTRCRQAVLSLGAGDSIVRHAEMPLVSASDMRTMLKLNAKSYLQQDLPDHAFDCHILPPRPGAKAEPLRPGQKTKVLVGGARNSVVQGFAKAAQEAGLGVESMVPGLIGPVNAFELSDPGEFKQDAVALIDLGFRQSSVTVLLEGELMLARVVALGGDRLTNGIADALGISYAEAEGIKVGLAHEVQSTLVTLLAPLGRELRASLDYFEHQQDRPVTKVYLSGSSARSELVVEILQNELGVPCRVWNPVSALLPDLPAGQAPQLEQAAPQLAVSVGAALAVL